MRKRKGAEIEASVLAVAIGENEGGWNADRMREDLIRAWQLHTKLEALCRRLIKKVVVEDLVQC